MTDDEIIISMDVMELRTALMLAAATGCALIAGVFGQKNIQQSKEFIQEEVEKLIKIALERKRD